MEEWNSKFSEGCSVSLIGMAAAGKSTLGPLLAGKLGWENADTDSVIEAYYGQTLQNVVDDLGVPEFRRAEDYILSSLGMVRTVISTGGSVVYGENAMNRLRGLGPVIYLRISCETCLDRIGSGDGRGLAKMPGQSLENLYAEREPLYEKFADFTVDTDKSSPEECAELIFKWLKSNEAKGIQ